MGKKLNSECGKIGREEIDTFEKYTPVLQSDYLQRESNILASMCLITALWVCVCCTVCVCDGINVHTRAYKQVTQHPRAQASDQTC